MWDNLFSIVCILLRRRLHQGKSRALSLWNFWKSLRRIKQPYHYHEEDFVRQKLCFDVPKHIQRLSLRRRRSRFFLLPILAQGTGLPSAKSFWNPLLVKAAQSFSGTIKSNSQLLLSSFFPRNLCFESGSKNYCFFFHKQTSIETTLMKTSCRKKTVTLGYESCWSIRSCKSIRT